MLIPERDEILYHRYMVEKDEKDLRELLERHREGLTLFLNGYVHNLETAEELMLDTFAVIASGTSKFDEKSSFKTWLYAIGRRLAAGYLRKQKFSFTSLGDYEKEHIGEMPDATFFKAEAKEQLYQALACLKEEYRQALYLKYFEEMNAEDAAKVMKKTPKQMYNLLSRGKDALREVLKEMGFEYNE